MIKAVFINYTDIIIQDKGSDFEELINRVVNNCSLKEPAEFFEWIQRQQSLVV